MTLTIELTPEQEARLRAEAAARGIDPESVLRGLVETLPPPTWGARAVDRWKQSGLLGVYGDMSKDAPVYARELRAQVEEELFSRDADAA